MSVGPAMERPKPKEGFYAAREGVVWWLIRIAMEDARFVVIVAVSANNSRPEAMCTRVLTLSPNRHCSLVTQFS